jgi:hypothetical protein
MEDEPSGPPSEEAEAQRLETVSPLIWTMIGTLVVLGFVAVLAGLGRPNPKVQSLILSASPPATAGSPGAEKSPTN